MAQRIESKEHYEKLLHAPIDWDKASILYDGDTIAYFGIHATDLSKAKRGTIFRAYYEISQGRSKIYRLTLFRVDACFDQVMKTSFRCYYALASVDFAINIWGQQL